MLLRYTSGYTYGEHAAQHMVPITLHFFSHSSPAEQRLQEAHTRSNLGSWLTFINTQCTVLMITKHQSFISALTSVLKEMYSLLIYFVKYKFGENTTFCTYLQQYMLILHCFPYIYTVTQFLSPPLIFQLKMWSRRWLAGPPTIRMLAIS